LANNKPIELVSYLWVYISYELTYPKKNFYQEALVRTILKSEKNEVVIDLNEPMVIIGEKINPTGRKKLSAALQNSDFEYVHELAMSQVEAGADILDVNVGVPGLDDVSLMKQVVQLVSTWVDIPLCLDSPNPAALEAGLSVAPGKPLVNSVSGEVGRLVSILPIVKDRGAAVIGLTMDDQGIPGTAEARFAIAEKILEEAVKIGIPQEDVIIDPLVMTVGSDSRAGVITIQTIELIRNRLGLNVNLGASNISFGLPERYLVNQAFMALAMGAGATCAITDPAKLTAIIRATDLVLGKDEYAMRYIRYCRKLQAELAKSQSTSLG
jgi:5-methyltetrahydrofolate--homocysteine methyltransferase